MSLHELKTWPDPFSAVLDGRKRYEVRKADRMFAEGDTLRLREWNEQDRSRPYGYTGRETTVRVTYITPPGAFGLPGDLCVMSIAPAPASPAPSEEAPAPIHWLGDATQDRDVWDLTHRYERGRLTVIGNPTTLYLRMDDGTQVVVPVGWWIGDRDGKPFASSVRPGAPSSEAGTRGEGES